MLVYGMCHAAGFRLDWRDEAYPNLTDPDTLAAFDRRLALRLGAPPEAVARCVAVAVLRDPQTDAVCLHAFAGVVTPGDYIDDLFEWHSYVHTKTDDPLLARVRAWRAGGAPAEGARTPHDEADVGTRQ